MRKRIVIALSAALLLVPAGVEAGWRRHAGFLCMPEYGNTNYSTEIGLGVVARGGGSNYYCPLLDDSGEIDRGSGFIIGANVHVNDRSPTQSVDFLPCVQFYGVDGFSCGAMVSSGTMFIGTTTLSAGWAVPWTVYPNDFAYAYVYLPQDSQLYGMFVWQ